MEEEKKKFAKPKRGRPATGHKLQGTEQRLYTELGVGKLGENKLLLSQKQPIVDYICRLAAFFAATTSGFFFWKSERNVEASRSFKITVSVDPLS